MNWYVELVRKDPIPLVVRLPRRFAEAVLEEIPDEELLKLSSDYLFRFWELAANGIAPCFLGRARTWKTYAAAAIARVVNEKGKVDTEFVALPSAMLWMEQHRFSKEAADKVERWLTVPFLVMDDFAAVSDGYARKVLEAVASTRHSETLPTLWTGNIRLGEGNHKYSALVDKFGPLFSRRLLDSSKGFRANLK